MQTQEIAGKVVECQIHVGIAGLVRSMCVACIFESDVWNLETMLVLLVDC